jgi:YidC/Oxa1 family membrane protein insertase
MDRNTILAFVLISAILIVWLFLNSPQPPAPTSKGADSTLGSQDITKEKLQETKQKTGLNTNLSDLKQSYDSLKFGLFFTAPHGEEKIITVENDLVKMELSTRGGNIKKYYLKKFKNWYSIDVEKEKDFYYEHVQLINYSKGGDYNLSFVTSDGKAINTGNLDFSFSGDKNYYKLSKNDSVTLYFSLNVDKNKKIIKSFTAYGDKYVLNTEVELNEMESVISNGAIDLVWDNGIRFVEENTVDEANYSNASAFYGGEQVIIDAKSAGEVVEKDFTGRVDWIAVRNKYFTAIISPKNPNNIDGGYIKGEHAAMNNQGIKETYTTRLIIPLKNANSEKHEFSLYIGPVDYDILKKEGNNLEKIVDFGSFFGLKFIVRPIAEYVLLPLFSFLHIFIPNYGFVIIVFSLIIKIVLYPLTKSSLQSMKKMQLLQPKITEIKEKFKDDAQKMNKETMKLYSTYGVNPAGGCLPLILQMPIFVAMWGLFQVAIELRQQPFLWWIKDLSRPDIIASLPLKIPLFGIDKISGLALLMGITTFVQQKMTMKDPKQQSLVYIMPVMLTLMFMSFPSGLNLYYFMFNLFSILQQFYVNKKHDNVVLEPVAQKPGKKKGFMERLMETAEQSAKAQQQKRKK